MKTPFFVIPLWALLLVASIAALISVICVIVCMCMYCPRKRSYRPPFSLPKSIACNHHNTDFSSSSLEKRLLSVEHMVNFEKLPSSHDHAPNQFYSLADGITNDEYFKGLESNDAKVRPFANDTCKKCCFSLKEIEEATNGFAKENVIGSGDNGIVYFGLLSNNTQVAVRKLACDSCQPEAFFAMQMEKNARVRHNKLVKLLGYCAEGAYRMSVSEFVTNGSLRHWLQFPVQISPLTWEIRMNIINGVAKGLEFLHEKVKPKILHGSLKSTKILLDNRWSPKISDFGLVKILSPEWSHFEAESVGYMVPNCHSSGTVTEGNDIYDFGLLLMEMVSGRVPSYQSQTQAHIVDWFKSMVSSGKIDHVVDPKLLERPSSKELKHVALVALRCVDPDVNPILKMRDVVLMLETNLILHEEHQIALKDFERRMKQDSPE